MSKSRQRLNVSLSGSSMRGWRPHCNMLPRLALLYCPHSKRLLMSLPLLEMWPRPQYSRNASLWYLSSGNFRRGIAASIIWLHDGLWVDKDLSNSIIHSAERIAAQVVCPSVLEWPSLLRIQCLQSHHSTLARGLPTGSGINLFPPPPYQQNFHFSKRHPKPRFGKKRIGQGQATFHTRMLKRRRH